MPKLKILKAKRLQRALLALALFISLMISQQRPQSPVNFVEAKKIVHTIFQDQPYTFYCHCYFDVQGQVDWQSCGYQPWKNRARASQVEVEHLMPALSLIHI